MSFQRNTILVALELSNSLWLVATRLPGAPRSRMHRISAGDTAALLTLLDGLRSHQSAISDHSAPMACCFEAGRDGFWLHRLLTANGIPTYVVEPASILVNRRAKRAKTDRIVSGHDALRKTRSWHRKQSGRGLENRSDALPAPNSLAG